MTAVAYDNPIPGFQTNNTINLRLWAAKPGQEFDLQAFNTGDYVQVLFLAHLGGGANAGTAAQCAALHFMRGHYMLVAHAQFFGHVQWHN